MCCTTCEEAWYLSFSFRLSFCSWFPHFGISSWGEDLSPSCSLGLKNRIKYTQQMTNCTFSLRLLGVGWRNMKKQNLVAWFSRGLNGDWMDWPFVRDVEEKWSCGHKMERGAGWGGGGRRHTLLCDRKQHVDSASRYATSYPLLTPYYYNNNNNNKFHL